MRPLPRLLILATIVVLGIRAEPIRIGTMPGLRYDISEFSVRPGETVEIVFSNDDDMEHNMVFTRPGARLDVVNAAMTMGAGGAENHYVPDSPQVLWHTAVVPSGESTTLTFQAPETVGEFPYVCTYPGHGFIMFGTMHVTYTPAPPVPTNPEMPLPEPEEHAVAAHDHEAPVFDDVVRVVRAFMPDAGPASIAVGLRDGYSYCWDAGAVRFRYAWHGGFGEAVYRQPMQLQGEVFYREEAGYPLRVGSDPAVAPTTVAFHGYTLDAEGRPTFHYEVDGVRVSEFVEVVGGALVRRFTTAGAETVWFAIPEQDAARFSATGERTDAFFKFSGKAAAAFSVEVRTGLPVSISDYYRIESLRLPEGEFSADAVAFMPDGRLMIAASLSRLYTYDFATETWTLFADGMHTPLGLLPESDTAVLMMQRPELTRVLDRDGDGQADGFETVSDDFGVSGNYAEFAFGPVRDHEGNLFYSLGTGSHYGSPLTNEVRGLYSEFGAWGRMNAPVPYRGWVMKVGANGETTPFAVGFREPNGLGIDPAGRLFVIDNQGDWVGASQIYHVRDGGFYGHVPPLSWHPDFAGKQPLDTPVAELDRRRGRPAVTFPYGDMSNSPTEPRWDATGGAFGPFTGQMFIGEMNHRRLMRVMMEEVDGEMQGAVTPFWEDTGLNLGNNRLTFAEDGSLWIGQTKHEAWVGESGLQRISWRGVVPMEVETMSLTETGFDLRFTRPIERSAASNPANYVLRTYFYNYHELYGSEKFDGRDVAVTAAVVSADGRTVSLTLAEVEPWRIYDFKLNNLHSADGHDLLNRWIVYTLNRLRGGHTPPPPAPIEVETRERRVPTVPEGGVRGVGGPQGFESP
ncbi:plastocyanin/azurin family copper-binding protein [Synoicihabitans lomoniglobus]|uniref:Plastocyanin/azurin family copper-binding protein n=1 Tax=Synoicihabitans lomoniglobus TaxID=2909285 RepID=A0AAE9ZXI3_9BACT|nr:plastocyanin/azurin family copper-binding protein [Opitutaceae bacterium LMO-M01]WED63013.1 plastocyanin/azurin family copper-binding protein [Opitutaceae bacterium LMO-M01]